MKHACSGTIALTLSILLVPLGSGGLVSQPLQGPGDEEDGSQSTRWPALPLLGSRLKPQTLEPACGTTCPCLCAVPEVIWPVLAESILAQVAHCQHDTPLLSVVAFQCCGQSCVSAPGHVWHALHVLVSSKVFIPWSQDLF